MKQEFGLIKQVDKGLNTTMKDLALTKDYCLKCSLSKSFTVVIQPLSIRLRKLNSSNTEGKFRNTSNLHSASGSVNKINKESVWNLYILQTEAKTFCYEIIVNTTVKIWVI